MANLASTISGFAAQKIPFELDKFDLWFRTYSRWLGFSPLDENAIQVNNINKIITG